MRLISCFPPRGLVTLLRLYFQFDDPFLACLFSTLEINAPLSSHVLLFLPPFHFCCGLSFSQTVGAVHPSSRAFAPNRTTDDDNGFDMGLVFFFFTPGFFFENTSFLRNKLVLLVTFSPFRRIMNQRLQFLAIFRQSITTPMSTPHVIYTNTVSVVSIRGTLMLGFKEGNGGDRFGREMQRFGNSLCWMFAIE